MDAANPHKASITLLRKSIPKVEDDSMELTITMNDKDWEIYKKTDFWKGTLAFMNSLIENQNNQVESDR